MIRQRTPGEHPDLQRPDDALHVARLDALGRRGIDTREPAMQALRTLALRDAFESAPQRLVAPRPFEEPACQRAVIKAGAADENRQLASSRNVANDRRRFTRVARR